MTHPTVAQNTAHRTDSTWVKSPSPLNGRLFVGGRLYLDEYVNQETGQVIRKDFLGWSGQDWFLFDKADGLPILRRETLTLAKVEAQMRATACSDCNVPMTNTKLNGRTVVASVWFSVEDQEATAILLNDAPPFYSVVDLGLVDGVWKVTDETKHRNITPALAEFNYRGGVQ